MQASQVAHAAFEFALAYPELVRRWHGASNTLVVLAAADELSLGWLCADATVAGASVVRIHEPDLDGALTAAAFDWLAQRRLRHLPLVPSLTERG